jgi:copper ion binding protein
MSELTINVPGMTCGHCEASVKEEIGKIAGVRRVDVDLVTKDVVVHGDDLDLDTIAAAVDEAGYEIVGPRSDQ